MISKEVLDAKVESILKTKELIKALTEQNDKTQKEIEENFVLPAKEAEELMGIQYFVKKTPVDLAKNDFDINKAKALLTPEELKSIEMTVVDVVKLKAMVKAKNISEDLVSNIKNENFTYKTTFKHIENVTTKTVKIKGKKLENITIEEVVIETPKVKKFLGIF